MLKIFKKTAVKNPELENEELRNQLRELKDSNLKLREDNIKKEERINFLEKLDDTDMQGFKKELFNNRNKIDRLEFEVKEKAGIINKLENDNKEIKLRNRELQEENLYLKVKNKEYREELQRINQSQYKEEVKDLEFEIVKIN